MRDAVAPRLVVILIHVLRLSLSIFDDAHGAIRNALLLDNVKAVCPVHCPTKRCLIQELSPGLAEELFKKLWVELSRLVLDSDLLEHLQVLLKFEPGLTDGNDLLQPAVDDPEVLLPLVFIVELVITSLQVVVLGHDFVECGVSEIALLLIVFEKRRRA